MSSDAFAIECRDLVRVFGQRRALDGLRLQVREGSVTALVGSNGAGKTTLMKILATLTLPTSGSARVGGVDVLADPAAVRRRIGYVPSEERSFYWRLTVRQNLDFFAAMHGARGYRRDTDAYLGALRLTPRAGTRFGELSAGMRQSLGIIRGLLHDPAVLILDEPTRSLSPDLAREVWDLLRRLAVDQGKSILIATHNLMEAETVADEVAVMHHGRIQGCGTLDDLARDAGLPAASSLETVFQALTREAWEGGL